MNKLPFINTKNKLPEYGDICEIKTYGGQERVEVIYCGLSADAPKFQPTDSIESTTYVGHREWRYVSEKYAALLSLKEQGWQDCADSLPRTGDEVWIVNPSGDVVRCRYERAIAGHDRAWHPIGVAAADLYFGDMLWRPVQRVEKQVKIMTVEDPPTAPVVPAPERVPAAPLPPEWHRVTDNPPEHGRVVWMFWPRVEEVYHPMRLCDFQRPNKAKCLMGPLAGGTYNASTALWLCVTQPVKPLL